jgi:hypothetical protein
VGEYNRILVILRFPVSASGLSTRFYATSNRITKFEIVSARWPVIVLLADTVSKWRVRYGLRKGHFFTTPTAVYSSWTFKQDYFPPHLTPHFEIISADRATTEYLADTYFKMARKYRAEKNPFYATPLALHTSWICKRDYFPPYRTRHFEIISADTADNKILADIFFKMARKV